MQSGRVRDGEEALGVVARLWEGVEKRKRFPCSPETGAQEEFVRKFERVGEGKCAAIGAETKWVDDEDESD